VVHILKVVRNALILLDLRNDAVHELPLAKVMKPIDFIGVGVVGERQVCKIDAKERNALGGTRLESFTTELDSLTTWKKTKTRYAPKTRDRGTGCWWGKRAR